MAICTSDDSDTNSWVVLENIETVATLSWKEVLLSGNTTFTIPAHIQSKHITSTKHPSRSNQPAQSDRLRSDPDARTTSKGAQRLRSRSGAKRVASHEDVKGMRAAKYDAGSRYGHLRGHTGRFNHLTSYRFPFEETLQRVNRPHTYCSQRGTSCTDDHVTDSEKSSCNGLLVPVTEFDVKHNDIGNGAQLPRKGRWNELEEDLEKMASRVEVQPWTKWKKPERHYYLKILGHAKFEKTKDSLSSKLGESNGYAMESVFPKPGYVYSVHVGPPRRDPAYTPRSLTKSTVVPTLRNLGVVIKVVHKPLQKKEEVFDTLVGKQKIYANNEYTGDCQAWTSQHTSWVEMLHPQDMVSGHSSTYMIIDLGRRTLVHEIRTLANYPKLKEFPDKTFLEQHGIESYKGPKWLVEKDAHYNRFYDWVTVFLVEYRERSGKWIPLRRITCTREIAKETKHTLNAGAGIYCTYLRVRPVPSFSKAKTSRVGIRLGLYGKKPQSCVSQQRTNVKSSEDPTLKVYTVIPREEKAILIPDCQGLHGDRFARYERNMLKAQKRRQFRRTIHDSVKAIT